MSEGLWVAKKVSDVDEHNHVLLRPEFDNVMSHVNHMSCFTEEDAKRIVACRNACEGIPTKRLVEVGVLDAADVGQTLANVMHQRDELLSALKLAQVALGSVAPKDARIKANLAINTAIANVERDPTAKQAGISREAMNMIVKFTYGALEKAGFKHIDNPAEAIEVLATQRDELLAALKASPHGEHMQDDNGPCLCSLCDFVRLRDAAIAKTEATHG
jgi:hypothetical protein